MIPVIKSKGNCHECFREDFFYFRSFHFSDTFHQRFMILWFSDIIRTIKPIKFLTLTQTLWFITINYHSEHFDFSNINETGIFWPGIDLNRSATAGIHGPKSSSARISPWIPKPEWFWWSNIAYWWQFWNVGAKRYWILMTNGQNLPPTSQPCHQFNSSPTWMFPNQSHQQVFIWPKLDWSFCWVSNLTILLFCGFYGIKANVISGLGLQFRVTSGETGQVYDLLRPAWPWMTSKGHLALSYRIFLGGKLWIRRQMHD